MHDVTVLDAMFVLAVSLVSFSALIMLASAVSSLVGWLRRRRDQRKSSSWK